MPARATRAPRDVEIQALDGLSRSRALTDRESERLAYLLYHEGYAALRVRKAAA
jgi:hypothetical protein